MHFSSVPFYLSNYVMEFFDVIVYIDRARHAFSMSKKYNYEWIYDPESVITTYVKLNTGHMLIHAKFCISKAVENFRFR